MKTRRQLAVILLVLSSSVAAIGRSPSDENRRARLQTLRTSVPRSITLLERAYLDSASILDQPSTCSQFFGGSGSTRVLERLVASLQEHSSNDPRTGLRMFGAFRVIEDAETTLQYRLFADVQLNTSGPFYKEKRFPGEPFVPNVGSFSPNTRAARVLILMHELAHLISGPKGSWLIPDDGHAPQLSRENTALIEAKCGREIGMLR